MTGRERMAREDRWSSTPTLASIVRDSHERFAERPAFRDRRRALTYGELGRDARRVADAVRRLGCAPGDRAIVIGANSCDWVTVDQGLVLGGQARVGVLARLHPAEVAQIAADVEPSLVFADGAWLARHGRDWLPPGVRELVVLGEAAAEPGGLPLAQLVASGADVEAAPPPAGAVACVMYTSGSTGRPKGVLATQESLGAHVRNGLREIDYRPDDVALHTAPISHFSGTILLHLLACGGLNVLEPSFDAADVIATIEAGEVTVLPLVPTMISMVIEELDRRGPRADGIGNLRHLLYAGSPIQPDRAARARAHFGDVMTQFYGATESPLPITVLRPADHVETVNAAGHPRIASAGRPAALVDVTVVDAAGDPLPAGRVGEIVVAGDHVSPGYWRRPEETAAAFGGRALRTGDVGYLDEHGYLFILDRGKDMIITGGFNVYPSEVENVISAIPGVREVAVVGAPDERWGEAVTAVLTARPDAGLDGSTVIARCRERIAGFKVPKRVVFVDEMPKSPVGKILKSRIRNELWAGRERQV